ncbi:Ribonuclease Z [Candidatus Tiddalikarchaeum anstoanum]|nr:Ribonuclease Z [Candidatus Tiddalikarchaeum anstoanum]
MDSLIFLGTGGGRFVTPTQLRATGGIVYKTGNHQIHIDPGPGALLRCKECKINPFDTDIIIVTHTHIDHSNDLNIMVEAVTKSTMEKRGTLITVNSVLEEKVLSEYHRKLLGKIAILKPGETLELEGLTIEATKCKHSHEEVIGIKFKTKDYTIYLTGDTKNYPGFEKNFEGADLVIANAALPASRELPYHMSTKDLIETLKLVKDKPGKVVITHFGHEMINLGPEVEAERIEKETGVKIEAAKDGMVLTLQHK